MKTKIIGIVIATLIGLIFVVGISTTSQLASKKNVDVVFVGPSQGTSSFEADSANPKLFFDKLIAARNLMNTGEYDKAIKLLKEALPYADFKFQAAVVYGRLAEIYRQTSDLNSEMESLKESAKYTGNPVDREQSLARVQEIQKLLDSQK